MGRNYEAVLRLSMWVTGQHRERDAGASEL